MSRSTAEMASLVPAEVVGQYGRTLDYVQTSGIPPRRLPDLSPDGGTVFDTAAVGELLEAALPPIGRDIIAETLAQLATPTRLKVSTEREASAGVDETRRRVTVIGGSASFVLETRSDRRGGVGWVLGRVGLSDGGAQTLIDGFPRPADMPGGWNTDSPIGVETGVEGELIIPPWRRRIARVLAATVAVTELIGSGPRAAI